MLRLLAQQDWPRIGGILNNFGGTFLIGWIPCYCILILRPHRGFPCPGVNSPKFQAFLKKPPDKRGRVGSSHLKSWLRYLAQTWRNIEKHGAKWRDADDLMIHTWGCMIFACTTYWYDSIWYDLVCTRNIYPFNGCCEVNRRVAGVWLKAMYNCSDSVILEINGLVPNTELF